MMESTGGLLLANDDLKKINLHYINVGGSWILAGMDSSNGVFALIGELPLFDPRFPQPVHHIVAIHTAIADAKLDNGRWYQKSDANEWSVTIYLKSRSISPTTDKTYSKPVPETTTV